MNSGSDQTKPPLIETHKELILFLNKLPHKKRAKLISLLKKTQLDCISEIFANFLASNLTQDKSIISKVKKYRRDIKRVALKRTSLKEKKKFLGSQKGGAVLSILLPIAASIISSLIAR